MDVDELIQEIRKHRLESGKSMKEVAEAMGVSSSFVQSVEYRKGVDRRWGTLMAYAEAVGVQVHITVGENTE